MPNKARGPTFGRYYGMLMYRGEHYLFMMDSHNRFVTHWDDKIVRMYKGLPTEKGVLSHYPEGWNNPDDGQTNQPLDGRSTTTYLCTAKFIAEGFPRLDGFVVHRGAKPRPQPWAAAGFLFADAKIISEIPFDPNLNYIFDGEEILYSVRMWTHGWDIFSPNENIMYHYYYRTKAKKFWALLPSDWTTHRDRALQRIQFLLNVTHPNTGKRVIPIDTKDPWVRKDLNKYGLGTQRSLAEYYNWAGIDHVARKIDNRWCPKA
jgi:UDP-GlcNAc:polypeptide alpha-N-acetylglucosaminyltransferase